MRTTIREKIVHSITSVTGSGEVKNTNFVVPDGMMAEIIHIQMTHTHAGAVICSAFTRDENDTTIIRLMTLSVAQSTYGDWPVNEKAADQTTAGIVQASLRIVIPSRHYLMCQFSNDLAEGDTGYIKVDYVLKPYTFNNEVAT